MKSLSDLSAVAPATSSGIQRFRSPNGGGFLEITTGISQICKLTINNKIKIVLVALLTSFGGLSGIAQTKSVLGDTRLSMKSYIIVKLLAGIIAFFLAFIYVSIFPIIR